MKSKCPCCGYLTLGEQPPGTYEICSVCFWEDDPVQWEDPNCEQGANSVSLKQARINYATIGACEEGMLQHVRPPYPDEMPNT